MNESEIPEGQLSIAELTTSPSDWLDIPVSGLTLLLEGTAVLGVIIVMLVGMTYVFGRLKALNQGFGPNSLKSLGVVLFLPSLVLLALLTEFRTETLAALLGTVAGYVLSNSEDKSQQSASARKPGVGKTERD